MPVMVIWQRGGKKANTKKRKLNENVHKAIFNDKFQINTSLDVDENGVIKKKISTLNVASDKERGILGTAELDLALFGQNTFNTLKLQLKKCKYDDAYIEVGIKGTPNAEKSASPSAGASMSMDNSRSLNESVTSDYTTMVDEYDKLKKEKKLMDIEHTKNMQKL